MDWSPGVVSRAAIIMHKTVYYINVLTFFNTDMLHATPWLVAQKPELALLGSFGHQMSNNSHFFVSTRITGYLSCR